MLWNIAWWTRKVSGGFKLLRAGEASVLMLARIFGVRIDMSEKMIRRRGDFPRAALWQTRPFRSCCTRLGCPARSSPATATRCVVFSQIQMLIILSDTIPWTLYSNVSAVFPDATADPDPTDNGPPSTLSCCPVTSNPPTTSLPLQKHL